MTSWPERYFSGLSKSMRRVREKELLKRRRVKNPTLQKSDFVKKTRRSRWTGLFHKTYPGLSASNKNAISKKTRISRTNLNTVYDRGLKAWKMGGSRPGASAQQWAIARMYKFVLVSKHKAPKAWYAKRPDPDSNLRRN